jgi:hypothetical protein
MVEARGGNESRCTAIITAATSKLEHGNLGLKSFTARKGGDNSKREVWEPGKASLTENLVLVRGPDIVGWR